MVGYDIVDNHSRSRQLEIMLHLSWRGALDTVLHSPLKQALKIFHQINYNIKRPPPQLAETACSKVGLVVIVGVRKVGINRVHINKVRMRIYHEV